MTILTKAIQTKLNKAADGLVIVERSLTEIKHVLVAKDAPTAWSLQAAVVIEAKEKVSKALSGLLEIL